ncbi:type II secretion system protein [bacterium]|nr:type II secretion system protein [bacterium]
MNVLELISRVDFSLPEKLDCHFAGRRKTAFTLAEALITLGIIGVVAAMTLPAIVQNYKQQVIISKLNKFYNTITNAYSMAKIKNGDISNWDLKNYKTSTNDEEDILYYLLPYLK